jgi:hypothetical protein
LVGSEGLREAMSQTARGELLVSLCFSTRFLPKLKAAVTYRRCRCSAPASRWPREQSSGSQPRPSSPLGSSPSAPSRTTRCACRGCSCVAAMFGRRILPLHLRRAQFGAAWPCQRDSGFRVCIDVGAYFSSAVKKRFSIARFPAGGCGSGDNKLGVEWFKL